MYNYKIKPSFFSPEMPKARAKKLVLILLLYIFNFVENRILYDAIHNFSVCLGTDSNPADINLFRSYAGKCFNLGLWFFRCRFYTI